MYNWTSTAYLDGWGISSNGSTDPCKSCHASGRIPSGGTSNTSDWAKLTNGASNFRSWSSNTVSTNTNATLYRYPWGSRYGTTTYGSITVVSNSSFADGKNYVAIMPASGNRDYGSGALFDAGTYGYYSSSLCYSSRYAYYMDFNSSNVFAGNDYGTYRAYGRSVRCVAEF
jgi:hypothetical protein